MKKALTIIVISLLCVSVFSILTPKVMGWASGYDILGLDLHERMALDALGDTGWSAPQSQEIADWAKRPDKNPVFWPEVDLFDGHGIALHRVKSYETILEGYSGGGVKPGQGAEFMASSFVMTARNFYAADPNSVEAQHDLGCAIHFIQDAVCPPHVFPFSEDFISWAPLSWQFGSLETAPGTNFEVETSEEYIHAQEHGDKNWPSLVRTAETTHIADIADLVHKIVEAANRINALPCSYVRQNDHLIADDNDVVGDPSHITGWSMSDENIGKCMVEAAKLVKGAAIYVRGGRSGGPDDFGYTYVNSKTPGGPIYDWIEISGTGTEVLSDSDDSWVENINLGFFFNYYGTDYSQLAISNNGLLFSGVGTWQYVNERITQTSGVHGFIAPYWDDIITYDFRGAGTIYYETLGTFPNRQFVVEWYDNKHYSNSDNGITFEAILYEGTNNILFQYKDVDFGSVYGAVGGDNPPYNNGGSATVGIEDPTGTIGLQYSFNEQAITPDLAILYKFPTLVGVNLHLSMNAPASMDHGSTLTYTLYYCNLGRGFFGFFGDAPNVVLQATLSPAIDFVFASGDDFTYDPGIGRVTWSIGTVPAFPSGRGWRTVTATIPSSVPVGTVIQTTASISTSFPLETRYDDNSASAQTAVTGSSLPPNVGVGPTLGNSGGTPSVYWTTPIAFTYNDPTAIGVDIRIHFDSGGFDITGSMTGGPPTWTYTTTFYPRSGHATVTYTVHYPASDSQVNFNIYVDPAGYIYDVVTLERISGASVWLQWLNDQGDWENVPTGQTPPIMQPDINPQITGEDGQYQWDVLEGTYRVHVEAPGYYPADSIVVNIPPPVTDLHVGLTPLPPPPDPVPPTTTLTIGDPKYTDPSGNVFVTSDTPFTLTAEDNLDGSGVATTGYCIRNADSYNSGWTASAPPIEFYLTGLADGLYFIDYNSTDNVGNAESLHTNSTTLDNSGPLIIVENPPAGWALQNGVTFIASASDSSGTNGLNFSIREANGDQGIPVGFEDIPATYDAITGRWKWYFNTLQLPDGYYIVLVNAEDNLGHAASTTVPYSIRNWAILELLPASQNNKAGRTMPVKFALRVAASVDPNQPFVYNQELTIKIYAKDNPSNVLQTSTFGDTSRDYRINAASELYITNFQTLKTPKTYVVEVYRKDMLIGSFEFKTTK